MKIYITTLLILLFANLNLAFSQQNILEIINKKDISYQEIIEQSEKYFETKEEGNSERKHYERWKFENNFHLNEKGYLKTSLEERDAFRSSSINMVQSTNSAWTELGPKSFNRTTSWNPGVGRITSISINPNDPNNIFVSSPGGGIWKTLDHGVNWIPLVDNNATYMNVYNVSIDPNSTNVIYAALQNGGIIKSIDAGATWLNTGYGPLFSKKVIVNPNNSNQVFAATEVGIFYSENAGQSWANVYSESAKEDIEFKPGNPQIMFASGNGETSVHKSIDGGQNWSPIGPAQGISIPYQRTMLAISQANPEVVYAMQANGGEFGKLYKSSDSGTSFSTMISGNIVDSTNFFGYQGYSAGGQAWYDMAIAVNPLDENDIILAGIICWRSVNGGSSFEQLTEWFSPNTLGYNHADVHALEWNGNSIYSGSDGGVYESVDFGDNWNDLSNGLGIKQLYRIANSPQDAQVFAAGAQDNGTIARQSSGLFVDWLGADGMEVIINPKNAQMMIGTSQFGSIYKTTDGGNSYSSIPRPTSGDWITPILWHPSDSNTVYGGWSFVYKSINQGTSWTKISQDTLGNFYDLAIAPSNDQVIYASIASNLYVTTNGGSSWSTIIYPSTITDIAVKNNDPGKVWITTNGSSNNVLQSTDYGSTYTNISVGLPALAARTIVVNDDANEEILVGMNIGIYYRSLSDPNWQLFNAGLPEVAINEIDISKPAGKLRIATYGRGIWEIDLIMCPTTISHTGNVLAQEYTSSQTIISSGNVENLTIYNAGKNIILNPGFQAGENEVFEAKIGGCSN